MKIEATTALCHLQPPMLQNHPQLSVPVLLAFPPAPLAQYPYTYQRQTLTSVSPPLFLTKTLVFYA